jgi:hypothetical protein
VFNGLLSKFVPGSVVGVGGLCFVSAAALLPAAVPPFPVGKPTVTGDGLGPLAFALTGVTDTASTAG